MRQFIIFIEFKLYSFTLIDIKFDSFKWKWRNVVKIEEIFDMIFVSLEILKHSDVVQDEITNLFEEIKPRRRIEKLCVVSKNSPY